MLAGGARQRQSGNDGNPFSRYAADTKPAGASRLAGLKTQKGTLMLMKSMQGDAQHICPL